MDQTITYLPIRCVHVKLEDAQAKWLPFYQGSQTMRLSVRFPMEKKVHSEIKGVAKNKLFSLLL